MTKVGDFGMRVDGKMYRELPEGHRTTYIVGMIDMLDKLTEYARQEEQSRLDALRRYARPLISHELRKLMDDYVDADPSRQQCAAASDFLIALGKKCLL